MRCSGGPLPASEPDIQVLVEAVVRHNRINVGHVFRYITWAAIDIGVGPLEERYVAGAASAGHARDVNVHGEERIVARQRDIYVEL